MGEKAVLELNQAASIKSSVEEADSQLNAIFVVCRMKIKD